MTTGSAGHGSRGSRVGSKSVTHCHLCCRVYSRRPHCWTTCISGSGRPAAVADCCRAARVGRRSRRRRARGPLPSSPCPRPRGPSIAAAPRCSRSLARRIFRARTNAPPARRGPAPLPSIVGYFYCAPHRPVYTTARPLSTPPQPAAHAATDARLPVPRFSAQLG